MTEITSSANTLYKRWKDLSNSKGIRKHGEFILMGDDLIREFLANPGDWDIHHEIIPEGKNSLWDANKSAKAPRAYVLSPSLFSEIDVLGTHSNLLVLGLPDWSEADLSKESSGLELVSPLGDPSNLGALVRSALAFGVTSMILARESANPFHPKSVKASAGAVLKMKFTKGPSIRDYKAAGETWALDMNGEALQSVRWPKNFRLLIGEEGPGVPELEGIHKISIKTKGVESLNATVAAAVALYEYSRSRS